MKLMLLMKIFCCMYLLSFYGIRCTHVNQKNDESRPTFGSQQETKSSNKINWSNIVIIIPTYNSEKSNALLPAMFKTWVTHLGDGADIVLVTDRDDTRTNEEILAKEYKNSIEARVHIYRSPAEKDGKRLRAKIIDAFKYTFRKFKWNREKQIFLKVDSDSFVVAENLLAKIQMIHKETYPKPVEFGYTFCPVDSCYTIGGLYGYNRAGFRAVVQHIMRHPDILDHDKPQIKHEDYFTSYVFQQATSCTGIMYKILGINSNYPLLNRYSVHLVKDPEVFYNLFKHYYDNNGNVKELNYDRIMATYRLET